MPRQPAYPDYIDEELLRVPMTLDAVIDAVHERWRLRLPTYQPSDGDPARALRLHRGEVIAHTLRFLREMTRPGAGTAPPQAARPAAPASAHAGAHAGAAAARAATGNRPNRSPDLALIDEDDVAVDIEIARCTRAIKQTAEAELRELHTYTSALVNDVNVSRDTNPFGPERFVRALWHGVQHLPLSRPVQVAFMHDAAEPLAEALRRAYASASERMEAQGVTPAAYRTIVFGGGTSWGADLTRYRPSEDLHQLQDSISGWLAPDTPGRAAPAPAPGMAPNQLTELLARLFGALQQEPGLGPPAQGLLARMHPVLLRLVQTDITPLDAYDHPAWRFMNQMAYDIECSTPAHLPRLLALCGSLVDHLATATPITGANFTWAIVRLAAARRHALEQALDAAAPHLERLQRIARDEASAATAAVPLDIGTLDTVPAGLLPEPSADAGPPGAFNALQASQPGTHLRCHLQGRWRHLMTLWSEPQSELLLLLEPASSRLWALRQSALSRLLGESLARPMRVRSLVRRAADRLLRAA